MIILDAQVEAIATRKDKTVKVTLGTQEMRDVGELFQLQNQLVSVGISTGQLTDDEIEFGFAQQFDFVIGQLTR